MPADTEVTLDSGQVWPLSYVFCRDTSTLDNLPAEEQEQFQKTAAEFLWRWTRQQFGLSEVTIAPTRDHCAYDLYTTFYGGARRRYLQSHGKSYPFSSHLLYYWTEYDTVLLSHVHEIVEVTLDGAVFSEWELKGKHLVRTDGESWPLDQNPADPVFEVTYRAGAPVPTGGQLAAGRLSLEFAKAACDDPDCALPERLQTVTREGVTVGVMDQFEDLDKGHTGVWAIDNWVSSIVNPTVGAKVMSPDYPRRRAGYAGWRR